MPDREYACEPGRFSNPYDEAEERDAAAKGELACQARDSVFPDHPGVVSKINLKKSKKTLDILNSMQ